MSEDWRNEPATDEQKGKLRFFGCTWDEGITAGQTRDSLEECARQFPDAEAAYQKSQPATEEQKDKLRFFGCTWNGDITVGKASDAIDYCVKNYPRKAGAWQKQKRVSPETPAILRRATTIQEPQAGTPPTTFEHSDEEVPIPKAKTDAPQPAVRREGFYPAKPQASDENLTPPKYRPNYTGQTTPEQLEELRYYGEKPSSALTYGAAKKWIESCKAFEKTQGITPQEVTIQEAAKPQNTSPREFIPEAPAHLRQNYEMYCPACNGQIQVLQDTLGKKRACPRCQSEIVPVFFSKTPREKIVPARVMPDSAPRPAVRKPATYKLTTLIERFAVWVDDFLERNQTCIGGHWLPVGPLNYVFTFDAISIGLCRQMTDTIESKGYCVEPDARFGNGTYDRDQTLALFKPFDGDPIQPSTAYLGAANLLRLCVLIATADGKIDLVELEMFRRAIENQPGLTLTDHKRLLILEQLLAQELCSASKTAARIAKSIPADKRLVIGKLLVEVAAANNFITNGERRVLYKIFKSFEIPPETLESLITQISPSQWPRRDLIRDDVSKNDRWLWNHWRTDHPGVVIDDTTLAQKTWNFNDWKALNARWRDLHNKLAARKEQSRTAPEASSQKVSVLETFLAAGRRLGIRGKKMPEPIAAPAPKDFTLDMARVYEITSETKEVVAILSVLMEDEPEKSIAPAATITLPAPELPKISGNAAPQPTRFNGLDAAFHPILERLLARDSWPKNDFKSLADEFHFMPSKIHGTLNEWADEALGDFILDGEDPVVIRRELMAKEKVYG